MRNIFKVGEKVVALENSWVGSSQNFISGTLYVVTAVSYCSGCGKQLINLNHNANLGNHPDFLCRGCNTISQAKNLGWSSSQYFTRPISHEYKLEVAIPELLEIKIPQLQ